MRFGIDCKNSFWGSFLESEGIPYIETSKLNFSEILKSKIDVLIISNNNNNQSINFKDLVTSGVTIVVSNKCSQIHFKYEYIDKIIVETNFSAYDFSKLLPKDNFENITYEKVKLYNGNIFLVVDSLDELWSAHDQSIKTMAIDVSSNAFATEKLCTIVKYNIRKYAKLILFDIAKTLDKPIISVWKYPGFSRNIINIRVDVDPDKASDEKTALSKINNTINVASKYRDRTSFMINFYRRMPNLDFVKKLIDHNFDIQSHSYYHCLFPDSRTNKHNIYLAHLLLKQLGINPLGFIAPQYFWYQHTINFIDSLGYIYSNSLGYDFSNYPYRPLIDNKLSSLFEISAIPANYNRFASSLNTNNIYIISEYFIKLFNSICKTDMPLLFYIHPQNEGKDINLLSTIYSHFDNNDEIYPIQLTQLAIWLQNRESLLNNIDIFQNGNNLNIKLNNNNDNMLNKFSLCVQHSPDKVFLYPISNGSHQVINLDSYKLTNVF